ncbi:MAG TPA: SLC13 family permease [Candidatus Tenderia sp.]|nr:SLC13 family permease [Candidatus Tenderia sp.]
MIWEAWFTLGVVLLCFVLLAFTRVAADIALVAGLTLLLLFNVLTPEQALSGLANEGMVTVGVLFVISAALKETGAIHWLTQALFGRPKSLSHAQLRVMAPVAVLSAFLNNTPVVAMMIPAIHDWARKFQLSVSKLYIPLSYAAIVGGTCTLIGTSTNLVINGLVMAETPRHEGLGMFELAWIGIPCTLITLAYLLASSRWLLPDRKPVIAIGDDAREYVVEMEVEEGSPLVGKSIEEAGLRQLPGMYLIEIERDERVLVAVSPHERLYAHDRLVFAGVVDSVLDLQKIRGLTPATDQLFKLDSPRKDRCLIEAVVSNTCPMVGQSIRAGRFRSVYNAAVIAVARNGEQIRKKIGDIVLKPGDTLLVETHSTFVDQHRNSRDFFLVSRLADSTPPRHERAPIAVVTLLGMVMLAATGVMSMLEAAMLAAGILIVTRCISGNSARRSVDWQVLIVIAAAYGIGQALYVTGAATSIAHLLLGLTAGSPMVALMMLFLVTTILTALITNNAAAVLMFPVALSLASELGVNFMPFVVVVMIAASASFATPIGYQTNLMVYGPGGYHFSDFIRIGVPLTLLVGLVTVVGAPLVWGF